VPFVEHAAANVAASRELFVFAHWHARARPVSADKSAQ
jgi:hypothetical protein